MTVAQSHLPVQKYSHSKNVKPLFSQGKKRICFSMAEPALFSLTLVLIPLAKRLPGDLAIYFGFRHRFFSVLFLITPHSLLYNCTIEALGSK